MIIAFDVDGTLIDGDDTNQDAVVALLKALHSDTNTIIVWSGGGAEYARLWSERLGIAKYIDGAYSKIGCPMKVDIAIDDQAVNLGTFNIQICRGK